MNLASRNPVWVEEELILALDLYLREGLLSKNDPAVIGLSEKLRALPFHFNRQDPKTFRNPTGVQLHLSSFATLDPNHPKCSINYSKRAADVWERYASDEDSLAEAAEAIGQGRKLPVLLPAKTTSSGAAGAGIDEHHFERFQVSSASQDIEVDLREQHLIFAYRDYLEEQGHKVKRHMYSPHGVSSPIVCDLVDETGSMIYEAKGDVRRNSVRMAIGQLLDYRRFEQMPMNLAVLLPRRPSLDIIEFIRSVPASAVWRTRSSFENARP